jgi:signal transduction histidine kinase
MAAVVALLLTTIAYLVFLWLIRQDVKGDVNDDLSKEGRRIGTLIHANALPAPRVYTAGTHTLAQVVDNRHRVIAASPGMEGRPPLAFPRPPPGNDRRDGRSCAVDAPGGPCFQIVEYRVGLPGPSEDFVYTFAPEPGLFPRPLLAALLALVIPGVTGLVGYGTWLSAGQTLRSVEAIRRELDEITATDLQRRVPVPHRLDEIAVLANSINATLDRLEEAVARQRAFVVDVSHELRSPLAGLRMELELALADPEATDLPATLRALLNNTDRVGAVVDDLLALSRQEADRNFPRETIDLGELADQEVLRRPRRARITVLSENPVTVTGGRAELARLLANLIDNADRHARSAVTVIVGTEEPATAVVEVIDDGAGIPPEDRERVFERFSRLNEGGHRDAGGTGLGLAISRDIAVAHRGSLILADRPNEADGARFILRLPQGGRPAS